MTKQELRYRSGIMVDLEIAESGMDAEEKAERALSAYHADQAIERTLKLKALIKGMNLSGHNIKEMIKECDSKGIDISIPKIVRKKADMYTSWEYECRYNPKKRVLRKSIREACRVCREWLNSGDTALPEKERKKTE